MAIEKIFCLALTDYRTGHSNCVLICGYTNRILHVAHRMHETETSKNPHCDKHKATVMLMPQRSATNSQSEWSATTNCSECNSGPTTREPDFVACRDSVPGRWTSGMLRSRDQRGLNTTFLVSRSHSNWSWSRPRSHEVLVSISYALVSWSQIDLVFLKSNDFWLCSVFC